MQQAQTQPRPLFTVILPPDYRAMLRDLAGQFGYKSESQAVRRLIRDSYIAQLRKGKEHDKG